MWPRKDHRFFLVVAALTLALGVLPVWLAQRAGGDNWLFNGLLLNPLDGHTYLAKMQTGWRGGWQYTFPYNAEPARGAYLFTFYVLLGHLARLVGASLPLMFNVGRVLAGFGMLLALHRMFTALLPETRPRRVAFALAALGSGLGWLLIPAQAFTADLWVAEIYPFLSLYANPHFPLGLAILVWALTPRAGGGSPARTGGLHALAGLALAVISPFGVVVAAVVLAGWAAVSAWGELAARNWRAVCRQPVLFRLGGLILGGGPVILYQFWVVQTDPVLAAWNEQNLTPTPAWWDVLASLSPALALAVLGAWQARRPDHPARLLLVWAVLGLVLMFTPFGLQRRFMMGLYVPLAGLAALGVEWLAGGRRGRARVLVLGLFLLALPTNLIVILAGQEGARQRDPHLFRTRDEAAAFDWLAQHAPDDAVVLAAPLTGLMLPAFSGVRVIYGHPFETAQAQVKEGWVTDFFREYGAAQAGAFVAEQGVDYIFYGPRERELGHLSFSGGLDLVYVRGDVQVFRVVELP